MYYIYEDSHVLRTPQFMEVYTQYESIANKLISDLNEYGYSSFRTSGSILPWHFTMIDNFSQMDHEQVVLTLCDSPFGSNDWTCTEDYGTTWHHRFGDLYKRNTQIVQWLEKVTIMQLTAICCIGNGYESFNIAMELAKAMEKYPAGAERDKHIAEIANVIGRLGEFGDSSEILKDFKLFELYYGIHLDKYGPVLGKIIRARHFPIEAENTDTQAPYLLDHDF